MCTRRSFYDIIIVTDDFTHISIVFIYKCKFSLHFNFTCICRMKSRFHFRWKKNVDNLTKKVFSLRYIHLISLRNISLLN